MSFQIIHNVAQPPAKSPPQPSLHSSLTDHIAQDHAVVIDCVYVLIPPCDWWSEMCVYHSVDGCHVRSLHAACTQNELCRWSCTQPQFQTNSRLNQPLSPKCQIYHWHIIYHTLYLNCSGSLACCCSHRSSLSMCVNGEPHQLHFISLSHPFSTKTLCHFHAAI